MPSSTTALKPAQLLLDHWSLFKRERPDSPILDLACGDGHNGAFLASKGLPVICCDISADSLSRAEKLAADHKKSIKSNSEKYRNTPQEGLDSRIPTAVSHGCQ